MAVERLAVELVKTKQQNFTPEELNPIVDSIKEKGLLHPITVHKVSSSHYDVIAGFKRFEALKMLGFPVIPCEVKEGALSEDDKTEIRLHENLRRAQLPWPEQVALVKALHDLRQKQHGPAPATGGRPAKDGRNTGWGTRDTAEELAKFGGAGSAGGVAQDLQLAQAITLDPSLAKVTDKKTALRLIRIAARRKEAEIEAGINSITLDNECLCGDSVDVLSRIPADTFDVCFTDPPWLKFAPLQGTGYTRDDSTLLVFKEVFRVLKSNGFLYAVVGTQDFEFYRDELPKFGFKVQQTPLIWAKTGGLSRRGVAAWQYARDYELILLAAKGNPVLTSPTQLSSIFTFDVVPPVKMIHPHEKPIPFIKTILEQCSYEGAMVLDPFGGSFATAEACKKSGRKFVIIERDPEIFERGKERLVKL